MSTCTKAIISVAGYGTRRLPITKTVEKCMLPFGNRPVVDYIVSDCEKAGITDVYFVVSKGSVQLQHYFSNNTRLERYLVANGKQEALELIQNYRGLNFHYVEQDVENGMYGTSIPVWLCREHISPDELVLVVMGDDITLHPEGTSDIERLVAGDEAALLGVPVEPEQVSRYGVIATKEVDGRLVFDSIQEKPAPAEAKSNLINVSKYLLPGTVMEYIDRSVAQGANDKGEYYITDPINDFVADGNHITVMEAQGKYLDSGNVAAWIEANAWLLEQGIV